MKAGYYQFKPVFGQVRRNLEKIITGLEQVSADLIVLPELALTGYLFKDREELRELAEDVADSVSVSWLTDLCRRRKFHLVTGFAERSGDKLFNSALLIGPKGRIHTYRKLHLFNNEKKIFDQGDTPLSVQNVGSVRIGMMVCFDWLFPEVSRTLALCGADVICHPSNLVLAYCQQTMITRCLENHVYAITANRFGPDRRPHDQLRFTGRSQIVAPGGELVHRAPAQREELYICDLDIRRSGQKKITPLNDVISDRRPEFYFRLCQGS
jgi:predicted amidohydrolase